MRIRSLRLVLTVTVATLWGAALSPLGTAAAASTGTSSLVSTAGDVRAAGDYCRAPVDLTQSGTTLATVRSLAVGNHEQEALPYDRVVIGLNRPAVNYQVRYVSQLYQDGSGAPVELRGAADLEVRIDGAAAHDDNGHSTVPVQNYSPNWRSLRQARLFSDFEAVVGGGIGVSTPVDFRVFTLTSPARLVIDLAMPGQHPWSCTSGAVKAFFLNEPRYVANTPPFFTPAWRRVATPAVALGALNAVFHGPFFDEEDRGLRLVNSEASGFTGLSIVDGIARVRLTGGCNAGGSTISIAGEIVPTLKQFPTVKYVKIYDLAGRTADPTGRTDSIPDCLNP